MVCSVSYAQSVYELLPGAKNNQVELRFSNKSKSVNQSVSVAVQESPEWIEFKNSEVNLEDIKNLQKETAQFTFNVSENAPIGEEGRITFS